MIIDGRGHTICNVCVSYCVSVMVQRHPGLFDAAMLPEVTIDVPGDAVH